METPEFQYIEKDSILYRAVKPDKDPLKPNKDPDTGKIGCYFSLWHPVLSDSMTIEYDEPLIRYKYITTDNIICVVGKYTKAETVNHIDSEIGTLAFENIPYAKAEVFLGPSEVNKVVNIGSEYIFPNEMKERYKDIFYVHPEA